MNGGDASHAISRIAYCDFRDDNVRGYAAEFSRAVCHNMVGDAAWDAVAFRVKAQVKYGLI